MLVTSIQHFAIAFLLADNTPLSVDFFLHVIAYKRKHNYVSGLVAKRPKLLLERNLFIFNKKMFSS